MEQKHFKVIIAGGRSFYDYNILKKHCDFILSEKLVDSKVIIISGGANGADKLGERYAKDRGLELRIFLADWETHGKSAGYKRNVLMAENADALIAFWDNYSRGTKHMIDIANERKLKVNVKYYQ